MVLKNKYQQVELSGAMKDDEKKILSVFISNKIMSVVAITVIMLR